MNFAGDLQLIVSGDWSGALWELRQKAEKTRCPWVAVQLSDCRASLQELASQHRAIHDALYEIANFYSLAPKALEGRLFAQLKRGLCFGKSVALANALQQLPAGSYKTLLRGLQKADCIRFQLLEIIAADLERISFLHQCYVEKRWVLLAKVANKKWREIELLQKKAACLLEEGSAVRDSLRRHTLRLLPGWVLSEELLEPFQNRKLLRQKIEGKDLCLMRFYAPHYAQSHVLLYHPKESWFFNSYRSTLYQYADPDLSFQALMSHLRVFHPWATQPGSSLIIES